MPTPRLALRTHGDAAIGGQSIDTNSVAGDMISFLDWPWMDASAHFPP